MNFEEQALTFNCMGDWLYGVLSLPEQAISRGVLIVVGGPQYRAGSHRQFTLLARHLASHGIPAMRFDNRGMGDSTGAVRTFEDIGDDLRAAIDQFMTAAPGLTEVVIWGLCDAASAALFYAHQDRRVAGLVLVNPWVRTELGAAKAYLKHYYLRRAIDPELWKKIIQGRFDYAGASRSLVTMVGTSLHSLKQPRGAQASASDTGHSTSSLPDQMYEGLSRFNGKILLALSGKDLTAQEFSALASGSRQWRQLLASREVKRVDFPEANHTFSRQDWRDQLACRTQEWLKSW